MSISDRMQNDGLSFEEACMKESLTMPNDHPAAGYPFTATEAMLNERGKTHGDFAITARIATGLKHVLDPRDHLPDVQREALDLICTKIARVMAGDSQCADHWDDIAGYAKLVSQDLQREKAPQVTYGVPPMGWCEGCIGRGVKRPATKYIQNECCYKCDECAAK